MCRWSPADWPNIVYPSLFSFTCVSTLYEGQTRGERERDREGGYGSRGWGENEGKQNRDGKEVNRQRNMTSLMEWNPFGWIEEGCSTQLKGPHIGGKAFFGDLSWLFKPGNSSDFFFIAANMETTSDHGKSKELIKAKLFWLYKESWLNSALGGFKLELPTADGTQPNKAVCRGNIEREELRCSAVRSKLLMPSEKPVLCSFFQ